MTRPPLNRTVFLLALPVLAEQMLGYGVSLFDTWLSGRLGAGVTGAVGLAAYVAWLAQMLFGLVAVGTTAIVARHWGAGECAAANGVANRSLSLAALAGCVYLAAMWPLAPHLAGWLAMRGETHAVAVTYLRVDGVGQIFTSVALAGSAALRGAGDMRAPMLLFGAMNLVNVAASAACVYGLGPVPACGADGIVYGTLAARVGGGLGMLAWLAAGRGGLRLNPAELTPDRATTARVLRVGAPAAVDGLVRWSGHFLFLRLISRLAAGEAGERIFAAHVVGVRIEAVTYLPALAWGAAAATLVGQNLGAADPHRARAAGHTAAVQSAAAGAITGAAMVLAAGPLLGLMHRDAGVVAAGVPAMRLLGCVQVFLAAGIVYISALRGAGDTRWPLGITLVGMYAVRLPLAYLCGVVLGGGLAGAWVGLCGDVTFRALAGGLRFAGGGWTHTRV